MSENDPPSSMSYAVTVVAITEGGRTYPLEEAARLAGLHPEMLRHYCDIGLLGEQYTHASAEPSFDDDALYWLRRIEHVRRQHGLNRNALPVICELWHEIERLRVEVRFLRGP